MGAFWNYFFGSQKREVGIDQRSTREVIDQAKEFIEADEAARQRYLQNRARDTYLQDLRKETPKLLSKIESMKKSEQLRRAEHPEEYDASGEYIGPQRTALFNAPSPPPPNPFAGVGRKVGDSPQFSPCDPLGPL